MKLEDENLIRRYLLNKLSEKELAEVEERTLTDREFFDHVQLVEDELLEEYLCDELQEHEKVPFQQALLSAASGRENLEFNIALKQYIEALPKPVLNPEPEPKRKDAQPDPSWRSLLAAFWQFHKPLAVFSMVALVSLFGFSLWLAVQVGQLQSQMKDLQGQQSSSQSQTQALKQQLDEANAENARLQNDVQSINQENDKLQQQIAGLRGTEKKTEAPETVGDSVIALLLVPGAERSGSSVKEARLTADKKVLKLTLLVREDVFKSFRVEISKADHKTVLFRLTGGKVNKRESETEVSFQLSAENLTEGLYQINLLGTTSANKEEPVERYYFSVVKTSP
jgi:cell division protein FtsL